MTIEALMSMLRARRSVRKFKPIPVERAQIEQILAAGIRAPSNHNAQPWHFVVVEQEPAKRALAEAMGDAWRSDLLKAGTAPHLAERLVARSVARFTEAPVLLLGCLDETRLPEVPAFLQEEERLMGTQSVAMALYGIQLAAAQLGLASCWYCAPLYCPDVVARVLNLRSGLRPQALLTIGYPDGEGKERPRAPWWEVTEFR